ncbi:MAG: hypothetical protein HZA90_05525 [Verrucomicrobia bacterium]|nr:hypothetical protein [Verrucomicrobiota bacterium]
MKAIRNLALVLTALLGGALSPLAQAATTYTDGAASFTVNLLSIPGNYAQRVDVYWVTDAAGHFVQTVRRDAGTRHGYLDQWDAVRGSWPWDAPVDGYSGATINTWGTFTVNWDCRNTNNVLMPDGEYRFWIEMTDRNGQGPYTTNGIHFYKGITNVNRTYPNQQYIQNIGVTYAPALAYDIAVTRIFPNFGATNALVPVTVTVTNKTSLPETFTITLSNATTGTLIGTSSVNNLGGNEVTNVAFTWDTAGLLTQGYSLVARASAVPNETVLADNARTHTITLRPPTHDVGAVAISVPAEVRPNTTTNVSVIVTNVGDTAESFSVVLTDDTEAKPIGTNQVNNLAAQAGATTTFLWNTADAIWGAHTLRAVAATVPEETATANNTVSALASVRPPMVTNTYLVKSNFWRYNDRGTNLGAAWREPGYDDSAWPLGRGPLGYADAPTNTVLSYGPSSSSKYPCYYFRAAFNITNLPSGLILRLRRDDGAVVYHNGVEVYRTNMPAGAINYSTLALSPAVGGADETTYFQTNLTAINAVVGTNVLCVEIHQQALDSSDVSFDAELLGVVPPFVPTHDVAIRSVAAPGEALPGTVTNLTVTVTNQGHFAESFAVVLMDDTDAVILGTNQVINLPTNAAATVTFDWPVPATPFVVHSLRAVAGPVTSEIARTDNTNVFQVEITPPTEMSVLIARGSAWRYSDQGVDLTDTPWKAADYFDQSWSSGPAPLGYGQTNLATTLGYGTNANARYPTYYFRQEFFVDVLPVSLTLNVRRDDGVIFYLNGQELVRMNAPTGAVRYADYFANNSVGDPAQYAYFTTNAPTTNLVVGRNVLAAELHQTAANSTDIVLDVELLGRTELWNRVHEVAALGVAAAAGALAGDRLPVTVTITNRGNATETALVVLKDSLTGQIIGSQNVTGVLPSGSASVQFNWATLGASNGTHTLEAYTVVGGVTNFAGTVTGSATVLGSGFGLNAAGVLGAIGGRCSAVAAGGNLFVMGAGATLEVWDNSTPVAPLKLGQVRLPGLIEGLAVGGSLAYAACGSAGVQFIDLSTPATPVHVNTFDTSGHAYGVAVGGDYLYVADGVSGVRVVNVASPTSPALAGAYFTEGPARAVALSGTRAYVLDTHKGLLILNVATPSAPTLLGGYTRFSAGQALAVAGNYVYVVDANSRFYAINASVVSNPTLAGSLLLTNQVGQGVVLNGTKAYVPAGDSGLLVLNILSPSAPALLSALPTPGQAVSAALAGSTLCVANGFGGFQVYDVATPASPVLLTDLPLGTRANDTAAANQLAYVAAGEGGLRIYSLTNPAAPAWIGWFAGAANARCVALSGTTAFVGDGQFGLKIVDVATPSSPALLGMWTGSNLASLRNVGVSGSLVLASDGRTVCLFDASTPTVPVLQATYGTPAFAFDMAVAGARAYLACGSAGFVVLDIAASALTERSVTDTPGFASGISVSGSTAYVADGANGWSIYDVANPAAPVLITAHAAQGPVAAVAVSGAVAALGSGFNTVMALDVSAPLTPVTKQAFAGLVRALRLTTDGARNYVSEDEAGLAILAGANSDDADGDGLPDAWEQQIVDANPNDETRSIYDVNPSSDFDHDGLTNLQEYLAGTGPADAASLFMQFSPAPAGGTGVAVRWMSAPGKTYTIHKKVSLSDGWSVLADNLPATAPVNTYTDTNATDAGFYIISVR